MKYSEDSRNKNDKSRINNKGVMSYDVSREYSLNKYSRNSRNNSNNSIEPSEIYDISKDKDRLKSIHRKLRKRKDFYMEREKDSSALPPILGNLRMPRNEEHGYLYRKQDRSNDILKIYGSNINLKDEKGKITRRINGRRYLIDRNYKGINIG